uniref:Uncharacterized protein n=1 Tax=viral metagenome TaxID=1070528 RepID=A0A6M3K6Q2_9ZZZZ
MAGKKQKDFLYETDDDNDDDLMAVEIPEPEIPISTIEPVVVNVPDYKINGLSPDLEKEAIQKLRTGVPMTDILEFYGLAAADVSISNK